MIWKILQESNWNFEIIVKWIVTTRNMKPKWSVHKIFDS